MVHPQFACSEGATAGEVLSGDEEIAIWQPRSIVEQTKIFRGDLLGIFAIGIHHPHVVTASGIAGEENLLSIG